jgi:hypothetical protein
LLPTANSPCNCAGVDKHGTSSETASGITTLRELVDELVDELALQCKQRLGFRRFPRKTARTWRLTIILARGIIFVKQRLSRVVSKILRKFFKPDNKKGAFPLHEGCSTKAQRKERRHEDRDPCARSYGPCPAELLVHASDAHGVTIPEHTAQTVIPEKKTLPLICA